MIEVKVTYYPPVAVQHLEGPTSIANNLTFEAMRNSPVKVGDVAENLFRVLRENCPTLNDELKG